MGEAYPVASVAMRLERVDRWMAAREYGRARSELAGLLGEPPNAETDIARVRSVGVDALSGSAQRAESTLSRLQVSSPEADAERLYYLALCARKQDSDGGILDAVRRLERYPQSPWREKALVMAGNHFLLSNAAGKYEPLYRAVYQSFPSSPNAAYCHWKVAWSAYLRRRGEAESDPFSKRIVSKNTITDKRCKKQPVCRSVCCFFCNSIHLISVISFSI